MLIINKFWSSFHSILGSNWVVVGCGESEIINWSILKVWTSSNLLYPPRMLATVILPREPTDSLLPHIPVSLSTPIAVLC